MRGWREFAGVLGFFLLIYGMVSAIFYSNYIWYCFFVVGGTFFLGYLNYRIKNKSIFDLISNNSKRFFKLWVAYIVFAIIIELVGRFLLNLWQYHSFNFIFEVVIGYSFAFFMLYETFLLIKSGIKNNILVVVLTTLIGAFWHEVPNTFVGEWTYTIPYVKLEILNVNIVVIAGWIILVGGAILIQKLKFLKK